MSPRICPGVILLCAALFAVLHTVTAFIPVGLHGLRQCPPAGRITAASLPKPCHKRATAHSSWKGSGPAPRTAENQVPGKQPAACHWDHEAWQRGYQSGEESDTFRDLASIPGAVVGEIPLDMETGTLYRNGPALFEVSRLDAFLRVFVMCVFVCLRYRVLVWVGCSSPAPLRARGARAQVLFVCGH